jgi:hypothetical protein
MTGVDDITPMRFLQGGDELRFVVGRDLERLFLRTRQNRHGSSLGEIGCFVGYDGSPANVCGDDAHATKVHRAAGPRLEVPRLQRATRDRARFDGR